MPDPDNELLTMRAWDLGFLIASAQFAIFVLLGYIWLTIQFFRRGETAVGILCAILAPFCLQGGIPIAMIFGWLRARRWGIQRFMTLWTAFTALCVLDFAMCNLIALMPIEVWQEYFFWVPSL